MNTVGYYLQQAQAAVSYVKSKMSLGAGNNGWDLLTSGLDSAGCVTGMRESYKTAFWHGASPAEQIRVAALWAEQSGCGNCGEQSAVAYQWLLRQGVAPVEYMNFKPPKDHAFVVLGRQPGSDVARPATWGPAAVVCDPWTNKSYLASQLHQEWPGGIPKLVEPAPAPPATLTAAAGQRR